MWVCVVFIRILIRFGYYYIVIIISCFWPCYAHKSHSKTTTRTKQRQTIVNLMLREKYFEYYIKVSSTVIIVSHKKKINIPFLLKLCLIISHLSIMESLY